MVARLPDHPEPMTDPLGDSPEPLNRQSQAQSWGQSRPPEPPEPPPNPVPDEVEEIRRGMPKKGILTGLMVIATTGLLMTSLFPVSGTNDREKEPVVQLPQEPMAAILKRNLPPEAPPPPAPPVQAPPEQPRDTKGDLQELILASKMEASEVEIDTTANQQRSRETQGPGVRPSPDDAAIKEVMAAGNKMVERMLSAQQEGGNRRGALDQPKSPADEFLEASAARQALPVERLRDAAPKGTLYQGSVIRLVLDGAVRSEVPGAVRARVVNDVYDSINFADLLIPRGSSVDCRYQSAILVGQSRMLLACERIRLPNGKSIRLPGNPAADTEGASGVKAEVDTQFWTRFGSVLMMGAASALLPREDSTTTTVNGPGGITQASSVIGNTLNQVITQTLSRNASIGPVAYIEPGTMFTVVTIADLQMEAYRGRQGGAR